MNIDAYRELPAPTNASELYDIVQAKAVEVGEKSFLKVLYTMKDWTPVAFYPREVDEEGYGDGVDVLVEACAWPAQFYRLVPLIEADVTLRTGSGTEAGQTVIDMATAFAQGMLVINLNQSTTEGDTE